MPIKIELALPPPVQKKSPKMKNFMGMGVFLQKEPKMPGAHKIGAAISGPRIAGGRITGIRFSSESEREVLTKLNQGKFCLEAWKQ